MAARSTTSEFYPAPPGKLLARTGTFRNSARVGRVPPASGATPRNMSTPPFGRTGNELDGYAGTLSALTNVAAITG